MSEQPSDERDFFERAALEKAAGRRRLHAALGADVSDEPEPDDQPGDEGEPNEPQAPAA
jgi:hypothetical protein